MSNSGRKDPTLPATSVELPSSSSASNAKLLSQAGETCCLIENGSRCGRPASTNVFSKRMEKAVSEQALDIYPDPSVEHSNICSTHKRNIKPIQGGGTNPAPRTYKKTKKSDSGEEEGSPESQTNSSSGKLSSKVKLHTLHAATLRRYKKYFKLQARQGATKHQLAEVINEHFETIPTDEREIITYFIYTVKTNRNKLDIKSSTNGNNASNGTSQDV